VRQESVAALSWKSQILLAFEICPRMVAGLYSTSSEVVYLEALELKNSHASEK